MFYSFRKMFLAGERCDLGTLLWVKDVLKLNPVDHYWQTGYLNKFIKPPIWISSRFIEIKMQNNCCVTV